jgi:acetyl esterase/lipase
MLLSAGVGFASGAAGASTHSPAVRSHEDVTYASRDAGDLKLDLYVPDVEDPPLVVWLHGGGWMVRTRKASPDLSTYFASQGYAMATVSYRLATVPDGLVPHLPIDPENPTPRGRFPDQIVDVRAAIRWLRAHAESYGYDAEQIATWGESSGGHLASLAGVVDDVTEVAGDVYPAEAVDKTVHPEASGEVQAVVARYPAVDFLTMDDQRESVDVPPLFPPHELPSSAESILLGGRLADTEAKAERASPLTYVSGDDPPFLINQGRQDQFLPYMQSRQLFETLRTHDVEATLYELHDLGHGYWVDELAGESRSEQTVRSTVDPSRSPYGPAVIEQFLDTHLRVQ